MDNSLGSKVDSIPKEDTPPSVDYYVLDGLLVMTEAYHLKRGYCCGSQCLHCPFQHINVPAQ